MSKVLELQKLLNRSNLKWSWGELETRKFLLSALREKFDFCFSEVLSINDKIFVSGKGLGTRH